MKKTTTGFNYIGAEPYYGENQGNNSTGSENVYFSNKQRIKEIICEASMCWSELPRGTFNTEKAEKLVEEIMAMLPTDEKVDTTETITKPVWNPVNKSLIVKRIKTITITDDGTLKTSELFAKVKEKYGEGYSCYSDEKLDTLCPQPNKPTTRTFLDSDEPDTSTLSLSYDDCKEKGLLDSMMTTREYLIMQLQRENHTDVEGWTLFPILDSDGFAMIGSWYDDDGSYLTFRNRSSRFPDSGPRVAVAINS